MFDEVFEKLSKSKFRSKFKLKEKDLLYIKEKGLDKIKSHAKDFIEKRIAPKFIPNDGKQTPYEGTPRFHRTACNRRMLQKLYF